MGDDEDNVTLATCMGLHKYGSPCNNTEGQAMGIIYWVMGIFAITGAE
jgi:hypothetical protein